MYLEWMPDGAQAQDRPLEQGSPDGAATAGRDPGPGATGGRLRELGGLALLALVVAASHFHHAMTDAVLAHFGDLVHTSAEIESGNLFVVGPGLWGTPMGLALGGQLYNWLSYPAWWFRNPIAGIHVLYYTLELLGLVSWLLLGRLTRLPPRLVWASAFMLAVYPEARLIYCENMTLAAYLCVPMFMASLAGLHARRAVTMILPGVLLAATFMVHHAAIVLAPAMAVMVLAHRPVPWRRGFILGGTALFTVLAVALLVPTNTNPYDVFPMFGQEPIQYGKIFFKWLGEVAWALRDPLLVVGLIAAVAVRKHQRDGVALAVPWILLGGMIITARIALTPWEGVRTYRMGFIAPGRALVAGMALLWLLDWLRPRLAPALQRVVRPGTLFVGASLLMAAVWGGMGLVAMNTWDRYLDELLEQRCTRQLMSADLSTPTYLPYRLYEALEASPLPARSTLQVSEGVHRSQLFLPNAMAWRQLHRDVPGSRKLLGQHDSPGVDVSPRIPGLGTRRLEKADGVVDHRLFISLRGYSSLAAERAGPSGRSYRITPPSEPWQLILVRTTRQPNPGSKGHDLSTLTPAPPGAATLESGGRTLKPLAASAGCTEPRRPGMPEDDCGLLCWSSFFLGFPPPQAHFLFELPKPMPGEMDLTLPDGFGPEWEVEAFAVDPG